MKHNAPQNPREHLEQRGQALAQKHHRRLQKMTHQALESQQTKHSRWIKPTMATTFSLLLITTVVFLYKQDNQHNNALEKHVSTTQPLPIWLIDTNVPITLIENLEFYHWLSQQTDKQHAQNQSPLTMAFNEYDQYRFSQRLSPRNLAERILGTTSDPR